MTLYLTKTKSITHKLRNAICSAKSIILIVLIAMSFRSFIAEPFRIPSGSMKSGLVIGDYIFVLKSKYGYSRHSLPFSLPIIPGRIFYKQPERGDVVVFRPPQNQKIHYIKRVIGIPGDEVQINDGRLYINNILIPQNQIADWTDPDNGIKMMQFTESIAKKSYNIVLDYNATKQYANNTRIFIVPDNHLFVLGDNRNHSLDSRFSNIGFIPKENIVGQAKLVVFSFNLKNNKFFFDADRFLKVIK